jgi:hypothetical protein
VKQWLGASVSGWPSSDFLAYSIRTIVAVERFPCLKNDESILSGAATGAWRDRLEEQ